jgi:hypothetical protein
MLPGCQVGQGLRTRRAGDVAPYLLSHTGPSYSQTTPAAHGLRGSLLIAAPDTETLTATPECRFASDAGDPYRDNGHVTAMSHFYRGEVGRIMVWPQSLELTTTCTTTIIIVAWMTKILHARESDDHFLVVVLRRASRSDGEITDLRGSHREHWRI